MDSDQRKHKRLKAESAVFAAFVIPDEPVIVGRIMDLSPSGAGVKYLATKKIRPGTISINIFGVSSHHMERIQSTVVYDMEMAEESWSFPAVRRCGVKFNRFSLRSKTKLKELMESHIGGKRAGVDRMKQAGGRQASK